MRDISWMRHKNVINILLLTFLVLVLGWLESSRPGGLSVAGLTDGIVTFDSLVRIGILTTVLVGLNLLMGYAGQVSLGQAAFYGMGAYFSGVLTTHGEQLGLPASLTGSWWWPWILMLLGMLLTGGFAYFVGRPILRLKGHYLAMATLGLGVMINILFRENFGFSTSEFNLTGGSDGIYGIPRLSIGAFELWPVTRYYYLVWLVAIIGIILALNIVHSRVGRALRAIHSNDLAAETIGVDTSGFKVTVLVVSVMYASLAGSLYAHYQVAVSPTPFDFVASLELVVMAAVGGMASIWGAPFGVAILLILKELLRARMHLLVPGASGEHEVIVFGLLLVLLMIFAPDGLLSGMQRVRRHLRARGAVT